MNLDTYYWLFYLLIDAYFRLKAYFDFDYPHTNIDEA